MDKYATKFFDFAMVRQKVTELQKKAQEQAALIVELT
jgi:hypothetical protein